MIFRILATVIGIGMVFIPPPLDAITAPAGMTIVITAWTIPPGKK